MKLSVVLFTFIFAIKTTFAVTVVIDPGHGGEDKGAKTLIQKGKKKVWVYEKDIALDIAKKIQKKLSKKHNVYLTRSVDRTISLDERAQLAEKLKADLFISIHANAGHHRSSNGFETFYLDNHTDAAVKKIESIENAHVKDADGVINQILADILVTQLAPQSKKLSLYIHGAVSKKLRRKYKMKDRGVKPGLFYVLALTKRPAVLLEAGFLTNQKELKKITSKRFQNIYASAVAGAIDKYISENFMESLPLF